MTGSDLVQLPDPTSAELAADPAQYVVEACERAKAWLANALEHGDIEQIVELKSQAEAIRVYTRQKELGKDAELSAAEIVRRAERGIGVAIRKGQEAGEIKRRGEREPVRESYTRVRHGKTEQVQAEQGVNKDYLKASPYDFASADELHGNGAGIYGMTDGVTDRDFDTAVTEAKAEGNLSRANVVRKVRGLSALDDPDWVPEMGDNTQAAGLRRRELIREMASSGYSSEQIGQRINMLPGTVREVARKSGVTITADVTMGVATRTRTRVDSNRIVRETVSQLEGLEASRYNGELEDEVAIKRLGQINGGSNGLLNLAESLRLKTGNPKGHCVAAAAVEIYNRGKGGKKLPSWWRSEA